MEPFSVHVTIAHPTDPGRVAEIDLLVDPGATLTWAPRELLDRLAVPRLPRRPFMMAEGRIVERDTAGATLRLNGNEAIVTVVFAEPGDGHLLGATALETLGFAVDPVSRRLVPRMLRAM